MMTACLRAPFAWLALALCVRWLPSLFVPYFSKDEGFWWAIGAALARGGWLYHAGVDHKPPLFLGSYGLAAQIAEPYAMALLHLAVLGCHATVAGCLYWIGARTLNKTTAVVAASAYGWLIIAFITQEVWAANSEVFMLPWMLGAVVTYVRLAESSRLRWALATGLLIGIAAHFRQTALFLLLAMLLHSWFVTPKKGRVVTHALCAGASALLVFALHILYFHMRGTLPEFWFWNITMSYAYVDEPIPLRTILWEFTWHTAVVLLSAIPVWWLVGEALWHYANGRSSKHAESAPPGRDALRPCGGLAEPAASMLLTPQRASMSASAARKPQTTRTPAGPQGIPAPATFFILCLISMSLAVCIGWRFSHHYYLHIFPFAALLCGTGYAAQHRTDQRASRLRSLCTALLLLLPALGFTAEGYYRWYQHAHGGPRPGLRAVAHWLRAHAAPTDSLFIWGYYPEIYADSGLPNASRYVETHFLTGQLREVAGTADNPTHTQLWRWFHDDLTTHPPTWWIDTTAYPVSGRLMHALSRYPELSTYVSAHYELVATIERVPIYRRLR